MISHALPLGWVREIAILAVIDDTRAVFNIYRYDTGIHTNLDSFGSGMVWWYQKVVWENLDCWRQHLWSRRASPWGTPTRPAGTGEGGCAT